jgi:hypothetical protein
MLAAIVSALLFAQAAPATEGALPLRVELGRSLALCETGAVLCPATVMCDDPSIVTITSDQRGLVLVGAKLGATICSANSASGAGMRRVFQITVVAKPPR